MSETTAAEEPAFGELLLSLRRDAGLTQAELAEASGMSVRALSDLERGRARAAQRRSTEALADALGLTGAELTLFLDSARQGRLRGARSTPLTGTVALLPTAVSGLVGRAAELDRLRSAALAAPDTPGGVVVSVVGHPGVGKTALAATAAHELREEFPDGCFSIDLRGMDDQPVTPRAALDLLLRALGVPVQQIPLTVAEQTGLFRSLLAGRRTMILLDNAADETQLRPLLARTTGCLTVITCRRALAGLESGRWIWLTALSRTDAASLVGTIIGADRIRAEPEAAAELAELCGNLPLAVRIAGNRLASRPHWTISHLVSLLRDEGTRLAALSAGDLRVRSAFEMSHRRLTGEARLVFRRLALIPGPDFGVEIAAVATGLPDAQVRLYIDELVDANLLQTSAEDGRYSYHDLIRLFASERLAAEEEPGEQGDMHCAVVCHLLDSACQAARWFFPEAITVPGGYSSREDAGRWLDREASGWLAAYRTAVAEGEWRRVIDVAEAMHWYSDVRQRQYPWDEVFELGVAAARELVDRHAEAKLLNFVGWARYMCLLDAESALARHEEALALAREIGNRAEETWALAYLGAVLMRLGRAQEALEHIRPAAAASVEMGFWSAHWSIRAGLGQVLRALGKAEEALAVHRQILAEMELHRGDTNPGTYLTFRAGIFRHIGADLALTGDWPAAAGAHHTARTLAAESGDLTGAADSALAEGKAWRGAGDYPLAIEGLRVALREFTEPFTRWERAQTLAELAAVLELSGDHAAARDHRHDALVLCGQIGNEAAERLAAELGVPPG
ncbi:helix-turn-helix transcriptional regulator [Amycolatopsis sp. GM8]|uniref:helix-turn-helix domain-containing protein n=1 Tax=Amycolatopsis sp. GM8 TaxID=2896530 RepID=UPI001F2C07C6|nr:helix-turn-helix transcriptional regulator [Amycolatopsis sp. GM8]